MELLPSKLTILSIIEWASLFGLIKPIILDLIELSYTMRLLAQNALYESMGHIP
jgi:hypothetical protein